MDFCIEWGNAVSANGYGIISFKPYRNWPAHRWAYATGIGQIPKGLLVLHSCDNPVCIRLNHLYVGNAKQNGEDRAARGPHKTHCLRGHPTRRDKYGHCLDCHRDKERARRSYKHDLGEAR